MILNCTPDRMSFSSNQAPDTLLGQTGHGLKHGFWRLFTQVVEINPFGGGCRVIHISLTDP